MNDRALAVVTHLTRLAIKDCRVSRRRSFQNFFQGDVSARLVLRPREETGEQFRGVRSRYDADREEEHELRRLRRWRVCGVRASSITSPHCDVDSTYHNQCDACFGLTTNVRNASHRFFRSVASTRGIISNPIGSRFAFLECSTQEHTCPQVQCGGGTRLSGRVVAAGLPWIQRPQKTRNRRRGTGRSRTRRGLRSA